MKTLAVFCGSSNRVADRYLEGAQLLGKELARRKITLIYGGARVGLMGAVANAALAAGGEVIGVIPEFLDKKEVAHRELTELIMVESMHERKAKMEELADGFIAMPGGPGTLEEFFEIFTWGQLGLHQKPLGLLNINHYYDPLIALFDHMTKERFLHEKFRSVTLVDDDASSLIEQLRTYKPFSTTMISKDQT